MNVMGKEFAKRVCNLPEGEGGSARENRVNVSAMHCSCIFQDITYLANSLIAFLDRNGAAAPACRCQRVLGIREVRAVELRFRAASLLYCNVKFLQSLCVKSLQLIYKRH